MRIGIARLVIHAFHQSIFNYDILQIYYILLPLHYLPLLQIHHQAAPYFLCVSVGHLHVLFLAVQLLPVLLLSGTSQVQRSQVLMEGGPGLTQILMRTCCRLLWIQFSWGWFLIIFCGLLLFIFLFSDLWVLLLILHPLPLFLFSFLLFRLPNPLLLFLFYFSQASLLLFFLFLLLQFAICLQRRCCLLIFHPRWHTTSCRISWLWSSWYDRWLRDIRLWWWLSTPSTFHPRRRISSRVGCSDWGWLRLWLLLRLCWLFCFIFHPGWNRPSCWWLGWSFVPRYCFISFSLLFPRVLTHVYFYN